MFDLEQAIADWRRQMLAAGIKTPVPLEELEGHLREDVEQRVRSGLAAPEAFTAAARQIGPADDLRAEFSRAGVTLAGRWRRRIFIFAGIPQQQFATNMNTTYSNTGLEPRWATYLKSAAFALPAIFLWLFSIVFIAPKVQQMCQQTGTSLFTFKDAPAVFTASAFVGQGMFFLTQHGLLAGGAVLSLLFLLEWRSRRWPRYRRAAIGTGTFLLNMAVLVSITLMVVSAVVAAVNIQHGK